MFAKLKKKIENDGGLVPVLTDSPGKSKGHRDSITSLPRAGSIQHLGISPPASIAGDSVSDESVSRDELVSLLQKKSEQCKKLESNISELAALVKDKSKTIEKLEITLRQQEEDANKKLQEKEEELNRFIENNQDEKLKLTKLLGTEDALTACQAQLKLKTEQCSAAEALVARLTDEGRALQQKVSTLESTVQKLKEENRERAELVTSLSKDRAAFEKKLEESRKEVEETQAQVRHAETQLTKLNEEYKSYISNSELQKKKTYKMLQEKADHIDQLQERVRTLEQRISDFSLTGDDRLNALQTERDVLEEKLKETRLELTEAKSKLGDTISLLEDKISHQNTLVVDSNERLSASHKIHDQMKESFNKQLEDLENELQKQKSLVLESTDELSKQKSMALESDTKMKGKMTALELQIIELESSRNIEREETKSKIDHLEKLVAVFADKETTLEGQVCDFKETVNILQNVVLEKNHEIDLLQQKIQDEIVTCSDRSCTIAKLQRHISELQLQYDRTEEARDKLETTLAILENEKGTLLEKIADFEKQIQAQHTISTDTKLDLERIIDLKSGNEVVMRQQLDSLEQMVKQNEMLKAETGLHLEKIDEMSQTISTLQTQLAEKSRTVKKQEQTLKDLRVTLQRELKVQALPNDDTFDSAHSNGSFSPSALPARAHSHLPHSPRPQESQRLHQLKPLQHHDYQQLSSPHGLSGDGTAAAVLSVQSSSSSVLTLTASLSSVSADAALTARTNTVKRELDKDVNFLYLKHVILKFMLSRETEAMQLIKAVSMLLNFTHQEQQLIKDTLEWKMSWFGHRPSLGEGQTAKVIPPTL